MAIIVSYLVWIKLFAIYRYLLPLEMLAPVAIWLLINRLPLHCTKRNLALVACLTLWAITFKPGNWGRVSWGPDYFGVHPPTLADPAHSMVLMTGVEPYSYVIPFFPEAVRFVRIESYFTRPSETPNGYDRLLQKVVSEHNGPLFVMYRSKDGGENLSALQHFNLQINRDTCQRVIPRIENQSEDPFYFCAVSYKHSYTKQ